MSTASIDKVLIRVERIVCGAIREKTNVVVVIDARSALIPKPAREGDTRSGEIFAWVIGDWASSIWVRVQYVFALEAFGTFIARGECITERMFRSTSIVDLFASTVGVVVAKDALISKLVISHRANGRIVGTARVSNRAFCVVEADSAFCAVL